MIIHLPWARGTGDSEVSSSTDRCSCFKNHGKPLCVGQTSLLLVGLHQQGEAKRQTKPKDSSASKLSLFPRKIKPSHPQHFWFRERLNPNPDFLLISTLFQSWGLFLSHLWLSCQVSPQLKPVLVSCFPFPGWKCIPQLRSHCPHCPGLPP